MKKYCLNRTKLCKLIGVLLTSLLSCASLADERLAEQSLRGSLTALLDQRPDSALLNTQAGLKQQPNFRSLHLLQADLYAAYAHQAPLTQRPEVKRSQRWTGLRDEVLARFSYVAPKRGTQPHNILRLSSRHDYALLLDASQSRLYLIRNENHRPVYVDDFYASVGKSGMDKTRRGDNKTPLGIYYITDRMTDDELAELYGSGAYPINYPNPLDQLRKSTGHGIWLHGMPRQLGSRPPEDSRGCIIIDNQNLVRLQNYIKPKITPIVLAAKAQWISPPQWEKQQAELLRQISHWQRDWESLEVNQYLSHYSEKYQTPDMNYERMQKTTRKNALKKTFVRVNINHIDLFVSPDDANRVHAVFDQDYSSNNYQTRYRKEQVWERGQHGWKIVYEGKVTL